MKEKKQKSKFSKTLNIAPANNKNQTAETNDYTQMQLQFITNGGIPSIAPGFQRSLDSSTVATVSFTRPSVKNFFERTGSWRAISSFYCSSFAMKRTPDMSLF